MAFSKYNRNRPFLLITHHASPANGQKTESANWKNDGKWDINEEISIVDRVNDRHITSCSVIVDILNRKLVKNRFSESHSEEEVVKHYLTRYNKEVVEGIEIWTKNRIGGDKEKAKQLIENIEEELNNIEIDIEDEKGKTDTN